MKITKRQRKQLRGPNAMVKRSIRSGSQYIIGNAVYLGKPATYFKHPHWGFFKTSKGLPFVRGG